MNVHHRKIQTQAYDQTHHRGHGLKSGIESAASVLKQRLRLKNTAARKGATHLYPVGMGRNGLGVHARAVGAHPDLYHVNLSHDHEEHAHVGARTAGLICGAAEVHDIEGEGEYQTGLELKRMKGLILQQKLVEPETQVAKVGQQP